MPQSRGGAGTRTGARAGTGPGRRAIERVKGNDHKQGQARRAGEVPAQRGRAPAGAVAGMSGRRRARGPAEVRIYRDTSPLSMAQVIEGRPWPEWSELPAAMRGRTAEPGGRP